MDYNGMKQKATEEQDRVELRSEKVRNIIGQVPSFLIRWGNTIMATIIVLLGVAYWLIELLLLVK